MHLTYHDSGTHTGTASTAKAEEAGAPGNEIEISDEMIAAGIEAYALWDRGDLAEWKVHHIYTEMEKAKRNSMAAQTSPSLGECHQQQIVAAK